MNPNTLQPGSLMDAIQQYYQMLQQNQAATNAQGVNPQILQGQQGVDLARVAAAQDIVNTPLESTGQPWIQNPDSPYLAQQAALLSKGPAQLAPTFNRYGFDISAGVNQANRNQYLNDLGAARLGAFFDTKILTPAERQMMAEQAQTGRLDNATGLLAGTKPMPGVDPAQLGMFSQLAQKDLESKRNLQAEKYKTEAAMTEGQANRENDLAKQKLSNEGQLAAAEVGSRNKPPTVYEMKAQEQADEAKAIAAQAEDVGAQFDDTYYLTRTEWAGKLGDQLEKKGIPNEFKPKGYDQFFAGVNDLVNNYIKLTGGPRGMSNENARKYILRSMFDEAKDASSARANLASFIAKYQVTAKLAEINAQQAAARGGNVNMQSPEFKELLRKKAEALDPRAYEMARQEVYKKLPKLSPNYDPSRPYKDSSIEDLMAKKAALEKSSIIAGN